MNYVQAVELMKNRIPVESLVSCTTYEMSKDGLLAEGILVPLEHLTAAEANGEWQEVTVLKTMEEVNKLSPEEREQLMKDAVKHFEFQETFRKGMNTTTE